MHWINPSDLAIFIKIKIDMLYLYTDHKSKSMNILRALSRFLSGQSGSLRFGTITHARDLTYETVADGKRNLRGDIARLGADWKKIVKTSDKHGKEN